MAALCYVGEKHFEIPNLGMLAGAALIKVKGNTDEKPASLDSA